MAIHYLSDGKGGGIKSGTSTRTALAPDIQIEWVIHPEQR